eukprot:jgi/Galph1/2125/GphlegSOOS_G804.1
MDEQEQNKALKELMAQPENKVCADCGTTGPRWASVNIGVFVCMTCSSLHRKLGVHISQIRSCTLDRWTEEQLRRMREVGNARANSLYEANLPRGFRRPSPEEIGALERWIRDKYERKLFMKGNEKKNLEAQNVWNRVEQRTRDDVYIPRRPIAQAPEVSSPALRILLDMGFQRPDAVTALEKSRGDIMQAVDWILIHGSSGLSQPAPRTKDTDRHEIYSEPVLIDDDNFQVSNASESNSKSHGRSSTAEETKSNFANFEEDFADFVTAEELPSSSSTLSQNPHEELRNKILDLYKHFDQTSSIESKKDVAQSQQTNVYDHLFRKTNKSIDNDLLSSTVSQTDTSFDSNQIAETEGTKRVHKESLLSEPHETNMESSSKNTQKEKDPFEDLLSLSSTLPSSDNVSREKLPSAVEKVDDNGKFEGFDCK